VAALFTAMGFAGYSNKLVFLTAVQWLREQVTSNITL
jgi:hypothetical protein